MSFPPSDPTSGFTSPDGWEPHDDAAAIGAILRGEGVAAEDPDPTEDPSVNVVGSFRRAFPGSGDILPAQGAGATALSDANRAGVLIYQVTNTNDSGAGSFRQAMEDAWNGDQDALKIIVFRVAGYIDVGSPIRYPDHTLSLTEAQKQLRNLYIAGQTAPGQGVCLRKANHATAGGRMVEIQYDVQDTVLRGLRFRWGYNETGDDSDINLLIRQFQRLVIDSCSFSWAPGRNISAYVAHLNRSLICDDSTLQNCIFSENFYPHSTSITGVGTTEEARERLGDVYGISTRHTAYRNLMASCQRRAPLLGTYGEIVNNISWNIREDAGWIPAENIMDYIGNVIYDGPMQTSWFIPFGIRADDLFNAYDLYDQMGGGSYYVTQNLWLARPGTADPDKLTDVNLDNWSNTISNRGGSDQGIVGGWGGSRDTLAAEIAAGTLTGVLEFKRTKRMWEIVSGDREWNICQHDGEPTFPVTVDSPYDVIEPIKANAGACWRVSSAGQWVQDMRDDVDARIVAELESGNPVVTNIEKLRDPQSTMDARFPYPPLSLGTVPTDTNGDGIPDDYYIAMGYDPTGASRAGEIGHDGYCFAENYVNGRDHHTGALRFA